MVHNSIIHILNCNQILILSARNMTYNMLWVSIGKPTTLGKIERWHRTYDVERPRFKRHEQFIKYYNNKRVHMSLNYMTPCTSV